MVPHIFSSRVHDTRLCSMGMEVTGVSPVTASELILIAIFQEMVNECCRRIEMAAQTFYNDILYFYKNNIAAGSGWD
jgi:hypothetical protein